MQSEGALETNEVTMMHALNRDLRISMPILLRANPIP